uniref:Uncharacterized protein LOC102808427 n=1 Tax=Saccoglossus kowalevskii TaxID=10224 RepID=A0ABM0MJQ7_SACKO|nr:PREDICTED: uncharacterized protein LOC102808427 [Saccoglossus kowalevskii]
MVSRDFQHRLKKSRQDATARERRRVAKLNGAFLELQKILPAKLFRNKTPSKLDVLRAASTTIRTLGNCLAEKSSTSPSAIPSLPTPMNMGLCGPTPNMQSVWHRAFPITVKQGFNSHPVTHIIYNAFDSDFSDSKNANALRSSGDFTADYLDEFSEDDVSGYVPPLKEDVANLPKANVYWK